MGACFLDRSMQGVAFGVVWSRCSRHRTLAGTPTTMRL